MRRAACVLVLSALAAGGAGRLSGGVATLLAPAAARCDSPGTTGGDHPRVKPSTLAPRAHSGVHVYGTPIQQPIFRSRPKPKSAPSAAPQGNQPQR